MGEVIAFRPRVAATQPPTTLEREPSPAGPVQRKPLVAAAQPLRPAQPAPREPLWREVTGQVLRKERQRQGRTLAQIAARAGMSVQYLSELERGRKEASSEMLAAACGAIGLTLGEFARRSAQVISAPAISPTGPVLLAA